MAIPFLVQLAIGVVLAVVGYILMPKPPGPKPPSLSDFEAPTAEAGRPIPVVFGSITISGLNNMGDWDKDINEREVDADKK